MSEIFARLVQVTDSLDLCNVSISSSPDKVRSQLAKVYVAILELIVLVTEYCAIGRTCEFLSKQSTSHSHILKQKLSML